MAEDNRIKIRELPASDVSGSDTIAVAKNNIEKTVQASLTEAVRAGLTIEAGPGITVTQTATGIKISGTAEFDDSDIQADLTDLQAQINALKNADTGASVKAQQTPPTGSANGDLWWDTNTASMYIRYNNAWVQTNAGGGGGGGGSIADTDAPGVVAPDTSFKVGHTGIMRLNSYVTIPTLDRSDSSGNNTRPRWQPNKSYFNGEHFRGPDINGNDATFGTPIRDIIYKTSRAYTSSNNFINDMNAKKHFYPGSNSGKGVEGGQLAIKNPDNVDMCIDTYKDVNNWFGRGMRSYIRFHDNTADGYQLLFDPFADGGAWLAHSPDLKHGDSTPLVPWGGGGGAYGGTIIDAKGTGYFYTDDTYTAPRTMTQKHTTTSSYYHKSDHVFVNLSFSPSSNQSGVSRVKYFPPGGGGLTVGILRKGGGAGHAYCQNISFPMAPGSRFEIGGTKFNLDSATVSKQ